MATVEAVSKEFLACRAGDMGIGIDVDFVQEVFETDLVTRIPGCPHFVKGMVNARGTVLPVLDLFGAMGPTGTGRRKVVILKTSEGVVGLIISVLVDLVRFDKIEAVGAGSAPAVEFSGSGYANGDEFFILDVERAIQATLSR